MARPKSVNREERPVITQQEAGKRQEALDKKISALLSKLLQAEENSPDKLVPDTPPLPLWTALQTNWKGESSC